MLHDRTQGIPFFVEELAQALHGGGRLLAGPQGLELAGDAEMPVPDTIRDAVLLGAAALSDAPAAPPRRRPWPAPSSTSRSWPGWSARTDSPSCCAPASSSRRAAGGRASATRSRAAPSTRACRGCGGGRCTAVLAAALAASDGPIAEVAAHWLAAGERERALEALLASAAELASVHAYGDAARTGRQALELWAESDRPAERLAALERYARCAELAAT